MPVAFVLGAWLGEVPLPTVSLALGLLIGLQAALFAWSVLSKIGLEQFIAAAIIGKLSPTATSRLSTPIAALSVATRMFVVTLVVLAVLLGTVFLFVLPWLAATLLAKHFDIDEHSLGIFVLLVYIALLSWLFMRVFAWFSDVPEEELWRLIELDRAPR